MLTLSAEKARAFSLAAMTELGLSSVEAETCTDCALFASLRGLDTHGLTMVLPYLAGRIAQGSLFPGAKVTTVSETATTAVLKGNGAPGPVVGALAMDLAIHKASETGVGVVTTFNAHHYGAASFYATRPLDQRMIGIASANGGPAVAPFGGMRGVHGTNPLAYAVPGLEEPAIVLDIATSVTAHNRIFKYQRLGLSIPEGWALTAEGKPTTDPALGGRGVLLPFGGHKGYGIAILLDVLTGALAGADIGMAVNMRDTNAEIGGQSFFMLALDPTRFVPFEVFGAKVDQLVRDVRSVPPAEGFQEVALPGDFERREEVRRRSEGIPLPDEEWNAIAAALGKAGVDAARILAEVG